MTSIRLIATFMSFTATSAV
jgi:hypothetical protein